MRDHVPSGKMLRFLVCQFCGREFGTASLGIHQKQCLEKQQTQRRLNSPMKTKAEREIRLKEDEKFNEYQEKYMQLLRGEISKEEFNSISNDEYNNTIVDRGVKVSCANCGRAFMRQEGLSKHKKLCDKEAIRGGNVFKLKKNVTEADTKRLASCNSNSTAKSVRHEVDVEKAAFQPPPQKTSKTVSTAKYCVECGTDFSGHADFNKWKFCPQCGVKKAY